MPGTDIHTGQLNTLYIIHQSKLYGDGYSYKKKVQYSLAGRFQTVQSAQTFLNTKIKPDTEQTNKDQLLKNLAQKCLGNSLTLTVKWNLYNGRDLDIRFKLMDPNDSSQLLTSFGYGQPNSQIYGKWYSDDIGPSSQDQTQVSFQKVSFSREILYNLFSTITITSYIQIICLARWFNARNEGSMLFQVSSGNNYSKKTFNIEAFSQEGTLQDTQFSYFCKVRYFPATDKFLIQI